MGRAPGLEGAKLIPRAMPWCWGQATRGRWGWEGRWGSLDLGELGTHSSESS